MKSFRILLVLLGTLFILSACASPTAQPSAAPEAGEVEESHSVPGLYDRELALEAFTKGGCGACHVIPGVPGAVGTIGPDLSAIGADAEAVIASSGYTGAAKTAADFLREAVLQPDAYIAADCGGKACQKGLMPASLGDTLSDQELEAVVG